jgi:hypothetical protein
LRRGGDDEFALGIDRAAYRSAAPPLRAGAIAAVSPTAWRLFAKTGLRGQFDRAQMRRDGLPAT